MAWTVRESPVINGTSPYDWNAVTKYQCTWYAYWRVQEGSGLSQPPCWYSGSGSSGYGAYTNAKEWLDHYRDPWQAISIDDEPDYQCQPGDIVVFTGTYGHVVVVERVNKNGTLCVSDYNLIGGSEAFGYKTDYRYGDRIYGYMTTGACIGVLHNPNIEPKNMIPIFSAIGKKLKIRRNRANVKLFKQ